MGPSHPFPSDRLAKFLEQSLSSQWQKDSFSSYLLGHQEKQVAATLLPSPPADAWKDRAVGHCGIVTGTTACSSGTENRIPPRSGKLQWTMGSLAHPHLSVW